MAISPNVTGGQFGLTMTQAEFTLLNGRPFSTVAPVVENLAAASEASGSFPNASLFRGVVRDANANASPGQPFPIPANSFRVTTAVTPTANTATDTITVAFNTGFSTDGNMRSLLQRIRRVVDLYEGASGSINVAYSGGSFPNSSISFTV